MRPTCPCAATAAAALLTHTQGWWLSTWTLPTENAPLSSHVQSRHSSPPSVERGGPCAAPPQPTCHFGLLLWQRDGSVFRGVVVLVGRAQAVAGRSFHKRPQWLRPWFGSGALWGHYTSHRATCLDVQPCSSTCTVESSSLAMLVSGSFFQELSGSYS